MLRASSWVGVETTPKRRWAARFGKLVRDERLEYGARTAKPSSCLEFLRYNQRLPAVGSPVSDAGLSR